MRVDSIIAINAHQQNAPRTAEYAGASTGKTVSGLAFEDYLKANLQQLNTPATTRQTESQLAGLLMGYVMPPRISNRAETKTESNAS